MKLIKSYLFTLAASLLLFSGCQKEEVHTELTQQKESIEITLVGENPANNATKTQMNTEGNNVIWSTNEKSSFYCDGLYLSKGAQEGQIQVTQTLEGEKIKFHIAGIPADAKELAGFFSASNAKPSEWKTGNTTQGMGIELKAIQKITGKTFDPSCDALVMKPVDLTAAHNGPIGMQYNRLFAITRLHFTGLESHSSEKVSSVQFETSISEIAGGITYDYHQMKFVTKEGTDLAGASIFTSSPSKSITMNLDTPLLLNDQFTAWMVSAPIQFAAGETVTITITTDQNTITKVINIPSGAELVSESGNDLTINMSGAQVPEEEDISGDYVLAVKEGNEFFAMLAEDANKDNRLDFITLEGYQSGTFTAPSNKYIWTLQRTGSRLYSVSTKVQGPNGEEVQYLLPKTNQGHLDVAPSNITFKKNQGTDTYQVSFEVPNEGIKNLRKNGNYGYGFYAYSDDIYLIPAVLTSKTQLAPPVVTVKQVGTQAEISVEWAAVPNATSYEVTCTGQSNQTVSTTSTTFSGLTAGNTYEVTVTAKADPSQYLDATSEVQTILIKSADATTIIFDVSRLSEAGYCVDTQNNDQTLPNSKDSVATATYLIDGYEYQFNCSDKFYLDNDYILWGKTDSYILLPAIDGKRLTTVTYHAHSGQANSTKLKICLNETTDVNGGAAQVLQKDTDAIFHLEGTTNGTRYQIRHTLKNKNARFTKITLVYE